MTVKEKVKKDLRQAYKSGIIKSKNDEISFINERMNYYQSMEDMSKKDGRLSCIALLYALTHGPLGVIDFIVFHPIKTIKAVLQIAIVAFIIYIIVTIAGGGSFANLFSFLSKK